MGVTVESQAYTWRIVPNVQWLSVEPMLGPLDISKYPNLTWVVLGGESKQRKDHEPRAMQRQWALDLISQCHEMGIAAHCKQTGDVLARELGLKSTSGKDPEEWPAEFRVQEFPREVTVA
jgi:protein gp37